MAGREREPAAPERRFAPAGERDARIRRGEAPPSEPRLPEDRAAPGAPQRRRLALGVMAGVVVLVLIGLAVWGFVIDTGPTPPGSGVVNGGTLQKIVAAPRAFEGKAVTVHGTVGPILAGGRGGQGGTLTAGSRGAAFALGRNEVQVLVVTTDVSRTAALGPNQAIAKGDVVRVRGTVRRYDSATVHRALGPAFDAADFGAWNRRRAMIVASAISVVPGTGG